MVEFIKWNKTPRYYREITVTEKIDGTNAALQITEDGELYAQSRNRLITPESDNAGFARWAAENRESLVEDLGPGIHFGEWWGQGIQRRYGLDKKLFSLFNTAKWSGTEFKTAQLRVVPVLYQGPHNVDEIEHCLEHLDLQGSTAAWLEGSEGQDAEGVCIYHRAANMVFKITLEDDEVPKGLVQ